MVPYLVDGNLPGLKLRQHAVLLCRQQHKQRLAVFLVACRATCSMDVGAGILWAVQLQHPVDPRKICTHRYGASNLDSIKVDILYIVTYILICFNI